MPSGSGPGTPPLWSPAGVTEQVLHHPPRNAVRQAEGPPRHASTPIRSASASTRRSNSEVDHGGRADTAQRRYQGGSGAPGLPRVRHCRDRHGHSTHAGWSRRPCDRAVAPRQAAAAPVPGPLRRTCPSRRVVRPRRRSALVAARQPCNALSRARMSSSGRSPYRPNRRVPQARSRRTAARHLFPKRRLVRRFLVHRHRKR